MKKGKVKTRPLSGLHIGSNVVGIQAIKNGKVIVLTSGISTTELEQLQELIVVFDEDGTLKAVPLKYGQWENAVKAGEVNSDVVVEFDIVGGKTREVAKIRPRSSQTDKNWEDVKFLITQATHNCESCMPDVMQLLAKRYILIKR